MTIKQFFIAVTIAFVFFGVGFAEEDCYPTDIVSVLSNNDIHCNQIYGEGQFEHKFIDFRVLTQRSLTDLFDKIDYKPGPDTVMLGYDTINSRYYLINDISYYRMIRDPDLNATYHHTMILPNNSLYSTEDKDNFCRNLDSIDKTVNGNDKTVNVNDKFNQCRYLFDIGVLNYNNLSNFPKKVILCQENVTVTHAYWCWKF